MAPTNFLSRFKPGHSAQADPNSRHARMASASSTNGQISITGQSLVASPPSTASLPPKDVPRPMPRLVLTTDTYDDDSIKLPGTPSTKRAPSILDDKDAVTMSPEETRSSEEHQQRTVSGQTAKSGPPRPIGALNFTHTPQSQRTTDDLATPTAPRHLNGKLESESTPKANGTSLPSKAGSIIMGTGDAASAAKKGLSAKPSNSDLRNSTEDSASPTTSFEGTRSRSNTQLLQLPSDGDGAISDSASIISASGKKKKKLWRKPSTSSMRKPTGGSALGAALAASGMSLAHPTSVPLFTFRADVSPDALTVHVQVHADLPNSSSQPRTATTRHGEDYSTKPP